jgi:hypothetical protein
VRKDIHSKPKNAPREGGDPIQASLSSLVTVAADKIKKFFLNSEITWKGVKKKKYLREGRGEGGRRNGGEDNNNESRTGLEGGELTALTKGKKTIHKSSAT